jgi:hypothetical protein
VVLTISGREIHTVFNRVANIGSAEIDLRMPLSVRGIKVHGAAYLMPDNQINPITQPQWLEIFLKAKDAVDFLLILTGIGGRALALLSFAAGKGLESAGDAVSVEVPNENTARIRYSRGWGTNVPSDTIIIPLIIPSLFGRDKPTELEITRICLDGYCVNPSLKAYVQPDRGFGFQSPQHLKNWMFRGQTLGRANYFAPPTR